MIRKRPRKIQAKLEPDHPFFEIIEEAYRVFSCPKPSSTTICDCYMDREIEADFFNPPIRELPLDYVRDWFASADPLPSLAKATWAYLLPRILEILAAGEYLDNVGLQVSFDRFETGNPGNWSPPQWAVLDSFQRKYLAQHFAIGSERLDDTLCMFRRGGWSLADLLDQLTATSDALLAQMLWNDWCKASLSGCERVSTPAFWEEPDRAVVFDFYTSPALYERMTSLALADDTEPSLAAKALAVTRAIEADAVWSADRR